MRCFLAIPCPESVRSPLRTVRDDLADTTDLRPVEAEQFHLTVKFLGDVDQDDLDRLDQVFQSRLPTPGPLQLELRGVGVFPHPGSASVAWAGIEPTNDLRNLYETVETVTVDLGYDEDHHDFRPHVTLGRFDDDGPPKARIVRWVQEHGETEFATFEAPNLHLYKSELTSDGPIYKQLVRWPL